jgi:hypothetical protein
MSDDQSYLRDSQGLPVVGFIGEDKKFHRGSAVIVWLPEDVLTLRPEWSDEQAVEFLDNNSKHLVDRSIEYGWQVMESLLPVEE